MDVSFLPLVGGNSSCFAMIKLLMPLACTTETAVRSRAVTSLASIITAVPGAGTEKFAASEEWGILKAFLVQLSGLRLEV